MCKFTTHSQCKQTATLCVLFTQNSTQQSTTRYIAHLWCTRWRHNLYVAHTENVQQNITQCRAFTNGLHTCLSFWVIFVHAQSTQHRAERKWTRQWYIVHSRCIRWGGDTIWVSCMQRTINRLQCSAELPQYAHCIRLLLPTRLFVCYACSIWAQHVTTLFTHSTYGGSGGNTICVHAKSTRLHLRQMVSRCQLADFLVNSLPVHVQQALILFLVKTSPDAPPIGAWRCLEIVVKKQLQLM